MKCPLYPQKRTSELSRGMSALCQKQTYAVQQNRRSRTDATDLRQEFARTVAHDSPATFRNCFVRSSVRVQSATLIPRLEKVLFQKFICLIVGCLMLAASAHAQVVGVVMMHGKHGTPAQLQQLAATVANAGFLVDRPEM